MTKLYPVEIQTIQDWVIGLDLTGFDKAHLIRHEEITDKLQELIDADITLDWEVL